MFEKIGHLIARRSKLVLIVSIIGTIVAGTIGTQVFSRFDTGGYSDPNSDSAKVWEYLEDNFGVTDPFVVMTITTPTGSVDDAEVEAKARALEAQVKAEVSADRVLSYWSALKPPSMKSTDGKSAFLFVYLKSSDFTEIDKNGGYYQERYDGDFQGLSVRTAGDAIFANAINGRIQDDLKLAEAISIPLVFILLVIIFGALVASAMPLVIGVTAILGTFFGLYLLTLFTDVSIFALNLTTGLGLGLGIDYALLMVNRFREELQRGASRDLAIINTMKTAGRTVFFSGLVVMLTLISLIFFPLNFLKSMGYAGTIVVALAVIGAIFPLPALLHVIGTKVNKGLVRKQAIRQSDEGRWSTIARFVMKRPVPVVMLSAVILALFIAPIRAIEFSQVDSRVLPKKDPAYQASKFISDNFPGQESNPLEVIFPDGRSNPSAVEEFSTQLAGVNGILRVSPPQISGELVRVTAIHSMPPRSPEGQALITEIREIPTPLDHLVGGVAADYTDSQNGISRTLGWVLLWVTIAVLVMLFGFTGSLLLPIKAVLLNFISLAATMGILTWIFVDGKLGFLVGDFINTGTLDTSSMVLIAIVAFGLSMDYEVFLLSRIKEEHDAGHSNVESVAFGLQKSARIITAAAFILAIVFAAFVTSGVTSIKMLGFGVAFAILLDATLVRAFLVPALMRLFGEWNWWAPKALRRFRIEHA